MPSFRSFIVVALCAAACLTMCAPGLAGPEDAFPDKADPFVGDYKGRWKGDVSIDPEIAAQVIALGGGRYRIRLVTKLDMRSPPIDIVEAEAKDGRIAFQAGRTQGEIQGDRITGTSTDGTYQFEMEKTTRFSPTLGEKPPEGAIVLFGGSSLDAWDGVEGWEILDSGVLMVTPKGGWLRTKQRFKDVKLHIEFRNSFMPDARGQQRSNSGVFLQKWYEVQILDSYGLEGYYNECGGLYKLAAPRVNACAPPLQWQTYDIEYRAPRFDKLGDLTAYARITVDHNGVLIHNDQELWWITAFTEEERLAPPPQEPAPIRLQGHSNYVQFRNIWLVDLAKSK